MAQHVQNASRGVTHNVDLATLYGKTVQNVALSAAPSYKALTATCHAKPPLESCTISVSMQLCSEELS